MGLRQLVSGWEVQKFIILFFSHPHQLGSHLPVDHVIALQSLIQTTYSVRPSSHNQTNIGHLSAFTLMLSFLDLVLLVQFKYVFNILSFQALQTI